MASQLADATSDVACRGGQVVPQVIDSIVV